MYLDIEQLNFSIQFYLGVYEEEDFQLISNSLPIQGFKFIK